MLHGSSSARARTRNLREPGRIHLDPFGNLHICQGLVIGNLFTRSLREICETYDPDAHPIVGPLLAGGPAELVRRYHLRMKTPTRMPATCATSRAGRWGRFPELLGPDGMYGVILTWRILFRGIYTLY